MITLDQLAYEIITLHGGGDRIKDSTTRKAYVIRIARQELNTLIQPMLFAQLGAGDRGTLPMYIATYENIDVKKEDSTKRHYIEIPEFYLHIPPFNTGIHAIHPVGRPLDVIIPRHNPMVTQRLEAGELQGQAGYYVEGLKAFFDENKGKNIQGKVTIKLIVAAPDSIKITDPLPIFPEQQSILIKMVRVALQMPQRDKVVDEVDPKVTENG